MSTVVRRRVPVAVVVAFALATAPASAQQPPPRMTADPPVELGASSSAAPRDLPRTGTDAGLVALAGASMLAMGLGLRRLAGPDG